MVHNVLLVIHVLIGIGLVALILLQQGKGADAGAAFGAGASGTVFGSRGSGSALTRITAILATLFFLTSLWLAYLVGTGEGDYESAVGKEGAQTEQTVPAETEETVLPGDEAVTPEESTAPVLPGDDADTGTGSSEDQGSTPSLPGE